MTELEEILESVLEAMLPILMPGEFGIGNEPESFADDDKKAWEALSELVWEGLDACCTQRKIDEGEA